MVWVSYETCVVWGDEHDGYELLLLRRLHVTAAGQENVCICYYMSMTMKWRRRTSDGDDERASIGWRCPVTVRHYLAAGGKGDCRAGRD